MPGTNFKNGVSSYGIPLGLDEDDLDNPLGKTIWVQSGHSAASDNNSGERAELPMSTLQAAEGNVLANAYDRIFLLPGHAETISAAAALKVEPGNVLYVIARAGNGPPAGVKRSCNCVILSSARLGSAVPLSPLPAIGSIRHANSDRNAQAACRGTTPLPPSRRRSAGEATPSATTETPATIAGMSDGSKPPATSRAHCR